MATAEQLQKRNAGPAADAPPAASPEEVAERRRQVADRLGKPPAGASPGSAARNPAPPRPPAAAPAPAAPRPPAVAPGATVPARPTSVQGAQMPLNDSNVRTPQNLQNRLTAPAAGLPRTAPLPAPALAAPGLARAGGALGLPAPAAPVLDEVRARQALVAARLAAPPGPIAAPAPAARALPAGLDPVTQRRLEVADMLARRGGV